MSKVDKLLKGVEYPEEDVALFEQMEKNIDNLMAEHDRAID